jgi:hypothetical protein
LADMPLALSWGYGGETRQRINGEGAHWIQQSLGEGDIEQARPRSFERPGLCACRRG